MTLRAVFLDVGNTLLYERPSRFELYAEAARAHGVIIDEHAMQKVMRRAHAELPAEVDGAWRYTDRWFTAYIDRVFHVHLGLDPSVLPALSDELFGRFSAPETFVLFPGVFELFDSVRAHDCKIGLVSNWSPRLPRLLAALGIAERVDFVLCSAIERIDKPDSALFERALELAEVEAHSVLHAGDDLERDVLGAQRVGIRAALVDHAGVHTAEAATFAPRVRNLAELAQLVDRLAR